MIESSDMEVLSFVSSSEVRAAMFSFEFDEFDVFVPLCVGDGSLVITGEFAAWVMRSWSFCPALSRLAAVVCSWRLCQFSD